MANLKLKQRIVGALVLAVIVAIILPVIFHNKQNAPELKLDSENRATLEVSLEEAEANKAKLAEQRVPESASPESTLSKSPSAESALSEDEVEQLPSALSSASKSPGHSGVSSSSSNRAHGIDPAVSTRGMTDSKDSMKGGKGRAMAEKGTDSKGSMTAGKDGIRAGDGDSTEMTEATTDTGAVRSNRAAATAPSIQPKAWVIQLGTFASHANANVLVKKLRANHFDVYATKEQTTKGISVMRVYVGPMIKMEKIKKIQQQLKTDFKLNGVIKPYKVVEDLN